MGLFVTGSTVNPEMTIGLYMNSSLDSKTLCVLSYSMELCKIHDDVPGLEISLLLSSTQGIGLHFILILNYTIAFVNTPLNNCICKMTSPGVLPSCQIPSFPVKYNKMRKGNDAYGRGALSVY